MSDELDLARSIFARWERGDFADSSWAHPDIECVNGFYGSSPVGIPAMAEMWREWLRAWDGFAVEAEDYLEVEGGVLVLTRFHGSGKSSGLGVDDLAGACLFGISEGNVTRIQLYTNRASAYEDLGIRDR